MAEFYSDLYPGASPAERYILIGSHKGFGFDVLTMAERKLALGRAAVYKYQFAWEAPPETAAWGAHHSLEGSFVFDNTTKVPAQSGGGPEAAALAATMADSWIAFARNGNPSSPCTAVARVHPRRSPDHGVQQREWRGLRPRRR